MWALWTTPAAYIHRCKHTAQLPPSVTVVHRIMFTPCTHAQQGWSNAVVSVCVCVCVGKKILKNASSRVARAVKDVYIQWKATNKITLECFCTWHKSRRFFLLLFQLLPIIGFLAPPLSKSHVVFIVSNPTTLAQRYRRTRNGSGS